MRLTPEQAAAYRDRGFLALPGLFDPDEVRALCEAYERDSKVPGPQRVVEDSADLVRAVYASHQRQPEFAALVRSSRMLGPVHQLLEADVYVYQCKVNAKPAFSGGGWAWHQDYTAWRLADNLPAPSLVSVGLFLDEVTEFNGPIIFVPGSHRRGLVSLRERQHGARSEQHFDPDDIALTPEQLTDLTADVGMESVLGVAGSVVLFDPQVVHGSAPNISPFGRRVAIVTYNHVRNQPRPHREPRPDYLVGRDTTPLEVIDGSPVLAPQGR